MEIFDWIVKNSEWLFSGVAVSIPLAWIGHKLQHKDATQSQEINSGDCSVINQAGRDVNVNNLNLVEIPKNLATPEFSVKQVGVSKVAGKFSKYDLEIKNFGGDCFNIKISFRPATEEFKFPYINRGQLKNINIENNSDGLDIFISGFDGNGVEYKKIFLGIKTTSGYVFQ